MFKDDAVFVPANQKDYWVYVLKFKSYDDIHFFWLQDNEQNCLEFAKKLNEFI